MNLMIFFDAINMHGKNQYDVNDIISTALPKTLPEYDEDVPTTLMMTQEHIDRHYTTPERPASNLAKQFAESPRLKYHYENGIIKDKKFNQNGRKYDVHCAHFGYLASTMQVLKRYH